MIGFSGGTSLEGTLAAQHREVCIDFNRHMNQVLEVRKDDMDVTVQPSVGYQELNELLAKDVMFFPPDPGPGAQIGGMISQGCSGTNAYRYGTMKDWVLGLEVVLADGTIIQTRHRPRKSSSGYDSTRLFTGSEGTLRFVTKAHLKLTRQPENVRVAVAQFPTIEHAVRLATRIVHQLEAMELLDGYTMRAINGGGYGSTEWPEKATLFLKIAGSTPEAVKSIAKEVADLASKTGSSNFQLAADDEEGEGLWEARKTALWSTLALKRDPGRYRGLGILFERVERKWTSQICWARSLDMLAMVSDLLFRDGTPVSNSKLGNFHATVLYGAKEKAKARKLISEIQQMSVDVDAMRAVKLALDPLCLLNPGKMIRMGKEADAGDHEDRL